ncbi:MAG: hypothetical protein J5779_03140 [Clostridia bacterium]|nr:hypothetical protein [Clostridia bacterium]
MKKKFLLVLTLVFAFIFSAMAFAGCEFSLFNKNGMFSSRQQATGEINFSPGIIINYTNFTLEDDPSDDNLGFKVFESAILPGDSISLSAAGIKADKESVDFYARIKFEYKFYDSNNIDVTFPVEDDYFAFISTPSFSSVWVDGNAGDGWYYFATGTSLNVFPKGEEYVNIFADNSTVQVSLTAEGFNHEGGGYKISDDVIITKVVGYLKIEAIEVLDAQSFGWSIQN